MATTFRSLSLQKKQPTHYFVKFTACGSFQVRSRGFFKCDGEIIDLGLYEVQYGSKKQVATAVVLASGTETDMTAKKLEREIVEDRSPTPSPAQSPTPSPRSPTPPPSPPTPPPRSSSNRQSDKMPTLRIPARRRKNTNKQQKKKSTPGNVILTGSPPSSSDEEQPPPAPEILTPQPPTPAPAPVPAPGPTPAPAHAPGPVPTPTPSPIAPNNIFPDDHRIYRLFDVMISGQSRLFAMMTNFDKRLKAMETEQQKLHAKQDNLERLLTTQRQATPGLLAVGSDTESDEENTIPADMKIPDDRLLILKDRAHSAVDGQVVVADEKIYIFGGVTVDEYDTDTCVQCYDTFLKTCYIFKHNDLGIQLTESKVFGCDDNICILNKKLKSFSIIPYFKKVGSVSRNEEKIQLVDKCFTTFPPEGFLKSGNIYYFIGGMDRRTSNTVVSCNLKTKQTLIFEDDASLPRSLTDFSCLTLVLEKDIYWRN